MYLILALSLNLIVNSSFESDAEVQIRWIADLQTCWIATLLHCWFTAKFVGMQIRVWLSVLVLNLIFNMFPLYLNVFKILRVTVTPSYLQRLFSDFVSGFESDFDFWLWIWFSFCLWAWVWILFLNLMLDSLDCKLGGFAELQIRWTADSPESRFAGLQMSWIRWIADSLDCRFVR